jgi:hypothetical protein
MHLKKLLCLICWLALALDAAAGMRAGFAARNVTPDPLLPVIGGIGPAKAATRKEGELMVRALVFEDGANRVAVVSADFLGFPGFLCDQVRAAVKAVPADNILIGSTHTHSAPDCYGFPSGDGPTTCDPQYQQTVCRRMAEAIEEAAANLRPATLRIGTGEVRGKIAYNYYAEPLFDPRCSVIQALDEAGKPFITLVNFAVHPEVIGSSQGICSPDLVGPLCEEIKAKGGGEAIFMNGAQGGMVTADNRLPNGEEARGYAECERIGRLLANEALRIGSQAPPQPDAKLACRARKLVLPVDSPEMQALMKFIPGYASGSAEGAVVQVNVINLGTAQVLTIPGEALPNVGCYLKRKMHGQHNLLFGLTNDAFGYILAKEDFDSFKRYTYITRTSLGERTAPIFEEQALKLVDEMPRPWSKQ